MPTPPAAPPGRPGSDRFRGQPHRHIAAANEGLVIGRPVRHAVLRLIRGMDFRLHPGSVAPAEGHEKCRPRRPTHRRPFMQQRRPAALSLACRRKRATSSRASSRRVATVGRRHACSARCCSGRRVRRGGWSPTRCAATGLRTERSCRPSPSARTDTRTIAPKSLTSPHGTARDTCAGSTLPGRHNDACPCMDSSAPSSAVAVTWCERCTSGNDEDALFSLGMPSRSPPDANCDHDPGYRRARRTLT